MWYDPVKKIIAIRDENHRIKVFNRHGEEIQEVIDDIRIYEAINESTRISFTQLPNTSIRL